VHVVVLDEHEVPLQSGVARELDDPLHVALAVVVARVGLAGEDELERPLRSVDERDDPVQLLEDQRRPLVGREAAGESDGQRVRVEQLVEGDVVGLRDAVSLQQEPPARELDELAPQRVAQRPELLVRHEPRVEHPGPERRGVDLALPARAQAALPEAAHRPLHPAEHVDAVRDVSDRHVVDRLAREEGLPHAPRDPPVELRDRVGGARGPEREHGHAEGLPLVVRLDPTQREEVVERHAELAEVAVQGVIHQVGREPIVSRFHRGVGGEDASLAGLTQRFGQRPATGHALARQLERQERRVPLVDVEDGGLDPERAEQAHAADAEQGLLHDPCRAVAAVDPQRQVPVVLLVLRAVRVEQVDDAATYVHAPCLEQDAAHRDVELTHHDVAVRVEHGLERQELGIEQRVVLGLPGVLADRLLEVALAVEEAHPRKTEPEVARRLGVVAGEDPEAAGGDGKALVQAELGAEVGDGVAHELGRVPGRPGVLLAEVTLQPAQRAPDPPGEVRVLQPHVQLVLGDLVQHRDRVVIEVLPPTRGELLEDLLRVLIPGPPEVPGEPVQSGR
jgi:hypothetical protein